jgi:toxin ParE1/3/4
MGIIIRSPASRRDFVNIWNHLAEFDTKVADDTVHRLDAKLSLLSDFPYAGPSRHELRPGLRIFPVGQYLIFYRPVRGGIQLVRAVHGSRDLRKVFPTR